MKKMKKFILSLGLIAMAFSLTNCSQEYDFATVEQNNFEIYASASRTTNDGVNTLWEAGDAINLFHAVAGGTSYVNDGEFALADATTGQFKGTLGEELSAENYDWYACYPYSSTHSEPGVGRSYIIGNTTTVGKQEQNGNNSTAHLAGEKFPLVGAVKGVANGEAPTIVMHQAASVAKFIVKNTTSQAITVRSIEMKAEGHHLTGYFFLNFTDMAKFSCTPESGKTSDTSLLEVANGSAIAAGAQAEFYLAVAPFVKAEGSELTFTVNAANNSGTVATWSKSTTVATTFTAGKMKDITLPFTATFLTVPVVSTEEEPYLVGFESSEGFTAGTTYNNATVANTGATNKKWGTVFGTPSTTGAISGSQSMQMRWYTDKTTIGYTQTQFALSTVKSISFKAKNTNGNNVKLSYMLPGGSWVDVKTFTLSTTANTYTHTFDTALENVQFKFTLVLPASPTDKSRLIIDDVMFTGNATTLKPTISATTGGATNIESESGTTATLNGSYKAENTTGSETIACGFEWKAASGAYTSVTATNAASFSYNLTGLTTGTTYTYRAWASLDGGTTKVYGSEVTFVPTKAAGENEPKWTLVKDVSELKVDDQIIIAASASNYAMSTTQNSNNRGQEAITKSGDNLSTPSSKVQKLTLKAGTKANTFALYTGSGYLYAASSSSNYLRTQTTNNDNGSWTITIASTGVATIKASGSNTKNWLRYNSSSKIFACYGSGQADVVIYKWK
ncbi:MAG: hypothetical protein IKA07_03995 [Alistipes sp.]|nr:hypothetical protein [Alistipes sp.]